MICELEGKHPEKIGPYRIISLLGRGGMGVVYLAEHKKTGKQVALKTVRLTDEKLNQSIRREIRALARIEHPGIVSIFHEGVHSGLPWYSMELLQGMTLRSFCPALTSPTMKTGDLLETEQAMGSSDEQMQTENTSEVWWTQTIEQPNLTKTQDILFPEKVSLADDVHTEYNGLNQKEISSERLIKILTLTKRLCDTLAFLHGEGIVHCDLKPENIFLKQKNTPVLVDFGLVTRFSGAVSRDSLLIQRGSSGTLHYMAPEQIKGDLIDARADLYSLGCILFELLTGYPPFHGHKVQSILNSHLMKSADAPSSRVNGIPKELDELVLGLLSKDPHDRLGYAEDVATKLTKLSSQIPVEKEGPTPQPYLYRPRFSGREAERKRFNKQINRIYRQGSFILIGGETGVGKTRFVMELGKEAVQQSLLVLTGECLETGNRPLEAFRKPLQFIADRCQSRGKNETERLLGRRGRVLEEFEPSLANVPYENFYKKPDELPAEAAMLRLTIYLAETLKVLSSEQPLVLIFDNLQWADDLSSRALYHIINYIGIHTLPLVIVSNYRTEEVDEKLKPFFEIDNIEHFQLDRLDKEAIEGIISSMLAISPVPEVFTQFLSEQSEGNPFFVGEYLRTAVDQGLLWRDFNGKWQIKKFGAEEISLDNFKELKLPQSVIELIHSRIDGLPDTSFDLVRIMAVIGHKVNMKLLETISESSENVLFDASKELLRRQIIEEADSGILRFMHSKIRAVVYSEINESDLKIMHKNVAKAIEITFSQSIEDYFAELAFHWAIAGETQKALEFYSKAAERAKDRYALDEAEQLYKSYIELADDDSRESCLAKITLGSDIYGIQSKYDEAIHQIKEAISFAETNSFAYVIGTGLKSLANLLMLTEKHNEALPLLERSIHIFREASNEFMEAECLSHLASLKRDLGNVNEAFILFERIITIFRKLGNIDGETAALSNLGILHYKHGDPDKALEYSDKARELVKKLGDRRKEAMNDGNTALVYMDLGRIDEAYELFYNACRIFNEIGDRRSEGVTLHDLAMLHHQNNKLEKAEKTYEQSIKIHHETGNIRAVAITLQSLAHVHSDLGKTDKTISMLHQALELLEKANDPLSISSTSFNLGYVHYENMNLDEALKYMNNAVNISKPFDVPKMVGQAFYVMGAIYRDKGDFKMACHYLDKAREIIFKLNIVSFKISYFYEMTKLERFRGKFEIAEKLLDKISELLEAYQEPEDLLHWLCEKGHLAIAMNKSPEKFLVKTKEIMGRHDFSPHSENGRAFYRFQRAYDAFIAEDYSKLYRGTFVNDTPPGILSRE